GITFKRNANEQAYLSVAIGNKEPSRDDFTDSSPLSRPKPEHMTDVEAGYSLSLKNFTAGINFYAMMYDNQLLLTGKVNDVGNYTRQNVKNSYRAGIELQAEYHLNTQFSFSGNAAFSKNKIKKFEYYLDEYDAAFDYTGQSLQTFSNTDISFSPNIVAAAGISYKPFAWLKIALNEKYVGRQYLDNTRSSDKSLDAFYYTNAVLEGNFNLKEYASVNVGISLYNLLNSKYANNGYTYGYIYDGTTINETYYYPQALMNYLAYARITF
ncbi:MAG: TonB-dependent receptor, partial [Bacteroidetes bacterium]|nr:TonB-dependent receptor [Bacteroidota bacterium]